MRAICALVLGTMFCSPALAQDIAGSTTIQIDPDSGTVTATCETDLNSADDGYYAARVTCVVNDQNGNLLASGAYSDEGDRNGYAAVTLTFTGVPGTTYTATGGHTAAVTVPFDSPPGQPQGLYYDEYNFESYIESPQTYNDYWDWFGPGPEQQTRLKNLHIGNTVAAQIRYYTQSELQALIANAQAILSPHCDAVFAQVLVPTYTNQSFFNSLRVTAFLQYPLGVPPPPDIGSVQDEPQADTLINQTDRPIRLFATFYPTKYGFPAGTQESVLTHEGIHHYTGWDDSTVANNLNITPVGYGTQFISDWVQRGCVN